VRMRWQEQEERRALTCENAVVSATEWGQEQEERRALTCENAVVSATEWGQEQEEKKMKLTCAYYVKG
jgi:hypothetical protein